MPPALMSRSPIESSLAATKTRPQNGLVSRIIRRDGGARKLPPVCIHPKHLIVAPFFFANCWFLVPVLMRRTLPDMQCWM